MQTLLRTLEEQEAFDLLYGAALLGVGGGGDPAQGLRILQDVLRMRKKIQMIDLEDVPDTALVVSPLYIGSIAPVSEEFERKLETFRKHSFEQLPLIAVKAMEELMGRRVYALVAEEMGGLNTVIPIAIATMLDIPFVDADYAGRAVPEAEQDMVGISGLPYYPLVLVDELGAITVVKEAPNITHLERVTRHICLAGYGGLLGAAALPLDGTTIKKIAIRNTITYAIRIGKAVREAKQNSLDVIRALVEVTGGFPLFRGKVTESIWEDRQGFMFGTNTIEGLREYSGKELKIWFKNENHIAWTDGKVVATSPDLICVVDERTAAPITNDAIRIGNEVAVVGMKAPPPLRTERGIRALGPKHFGFDIEYVPIERLFGHQA